MERVKKEVQVVVHCLLNPSARVKGLKSLNYMPSGQLIQLLCPEALYLGLDRWMVTKNQLEIPEFRRFCHSLLTYSADLIEMLAHEGTDIKIVGIAGSPSCGVKTTSRGYSGGKAQEQAYEHIPGAGIFIEELMVELKRRGVSFECEEL